MDKYKTIGRTEMKWEVGSLRHSAWLWCGRVLFGFALKRVGLANTYTRRQNYIKNVF